jgi:hypothetical protein
MEDYVYNSETKQVYLKFDRTLVAIDVEDFMEVFYCIEAARADIALDPEVEIGEYEDDEGHVWQEYLVKDTNQEYS